MAKKKKVVKKAKKVQEEMMLQLDGKVYFIVYKNGKVSEQTEIDGKIVLQLLLKAIEEGIDLLVNKHELGKQLELPLDEEEE